MRATESLTGIATGVPRRWNVVPSESACVRLDGAKICAWWPRLVSSFARYRTWSVTPPGDAKSYGETSPTFMSAPNGLWTAFPDPVRDVPLLGIAADELLDLAQQLLGDAQLVRLVVAGPLGDDQRGAFHLVRVVGQPVYAHRQKRRPHPQGKRGRAGWDRGRTAEERHHPASTGDVAVDRRDHELVVPQCLSHLAQSRQV